MKSLGVLESYRNLKVEDQIVFEESEEKKKNQKKKKKKEKEEHKKQKVLIKYDEI